MTIMSVHFGVCNVFRKSHTDYLHINKEDCCMLRVNFR